jgi:hypothetical protein
MRHILLASILCLSVGCVGGITPGDDDVADDDDDNPPPVSILGKQKYDTEVYPIMTAKCSAQGCHMVGTSGSTAFVTPTVADAHFTVTSYSSVVGNFTETGAPILTKITQTAHFATYTPTEDASIRGWLAQEVIDRQQQPNPQDPPPTETPGAATQRIISEWSGCLLETDFVELQFGECFANKGSNQGNCEQCHTSGLGGFLANDDNVYTYQALSQNKYFMLMYFRPDVTNLQNAMMMPNIEAFERVGNNESPFTEHPAFDINDQTAGLGMSPAEALQTLYDRTMARKLAGTCGPPTLMN